MCHQQHNYNKEESYLNILSWPSRMILSKKAIGFCQFSLSSRIMTALKTTVFLKLLVKNLSFKIARTLLDTVFGFTLTTYPSLLVEEIVRIDKWLSITFVNIDICDTQNIFNLIIIFDNSNTVTMSWKRNHLSISFDFWLHKFRHCNYRKEKILSRIGYNNTASFVLIQNCYLSVGWLIYWGRENFKSYMRHEAVTRFP